jgi:hypothetical protein
MIKLMIRLKGLKTISHNYRHRGTTTCLTISMPCYFFSNWLTSRTAPRAALVVMAA